MSWLDDLKKAQEDKINAIERLYEDPTSYLEKGGKPAQIGEIREFAGKKYQKGTNGWRPVKKGDQGGSEKKEHINITIANLATELGKKHPDKSNDQLLRMAAKQLAHQVVDNGEGEFRFRDISHFTVEGIKNVPLVELKMRIDKNNRFSPQTRKMARLEIERRENDKGEKTEKLYGDDASGLSNKELKEKYHMYNKVSQKPTFNEHGKKLLAKYKGEMEERGMLPKDTSGKQPKVEFLGKDYRGDFIVKTSDGVMTYTKNEMAEEFPDTKTTTPKVGPTITDKKGKKWQLVATDGDSYFVSDGGEVTEYTKNEMKEIFGKVDADASSVQEKKEGSSLNIGGHEFRLNIDVDGDMTFSDGKGVIYHNEPSEKKEEFISRVHAEIKRKYAAKK